jgi:hypothetical protein
MLKKYSLFSIVLIISLLVLSLYASLPLSAASSTAWITAESATSKKVNCVWGIKSTDVYAAGESGTILHYDGAYWSAVNDDNATDDLYALWGNSSKDVFAVGESGTILHYNGSIWSSMTSGTSKDLHGIWGADANSVFAVGNSGTILFYNGLKWNSLSSGVTSNLQCVWGIDDTDVFVAGNSGIILHYNGTAWTAQSSGTTGNIYGIRGIDNGDIFAVGSSGTILRYQGDSWNALSSGTKNDLNSIWGSGGTDVFAVGELGTIVHFDGTAWTSMNKNTINNLFGVWGSASIDVFAVGESGTILHYIPPLIDSLSNSTGAQGATLDITITGTNLKGTTEVKFGAGIAVNSFTVSNSKEIEVNITIVGEAATGARDVSITTPSGSFTLADSFTVKRSPPSLRSINPEQDRQGATLNVTLNGRNLSGTTEVYLGEGISVNSFSTLSSSQISANITIAANASVGARDVSITTTGGSDTLQGGFTVIPAQPVIDSVTPGQGNQAADLGITLNGANFSAASGIQFGDGIEVKSFSVISSGQISVNISIAASADIGARPVSITTPGGSFVLPDGFAVIQALPQISSVNPAEGSQGATLNVTISGLNLNGATEVRLGSGVAVNSFIILNPEQIQAEITIVAGAVTGTRDVTLTTPGGSTSLSRGFNVKQGLPTIASINPKEGDMGESLKVIISGNNLDGASSISFGPGIAVHSFSNLSQTQISVNLIIDDSATAGLRNVTVTTPGGTSSMGNSFNVKEKSLGTLILTLIWIGIALVIVLFVVVIRQLKKKNAVKL